MTIPQLDSIKTEGQAHQLAVSWQIINGQTHQTFGEIAEWQAFFRELARKFDLRDEFEENGIL